MYGAVAADHLRLPRNLGKIESPDGVGHVEERATDTHVTVYVRLARSETGDLLVREARFRALGCGGCIIAASVATELATGRTVSAAHGLDAATLVTALEDGLPPDQRYCADLVVRALRMALASSANRGTSSE